MYYYEIHIDDSKKLYQSKYIYSMDELKQTIEQFEMDYLSNNKFNEDYVPPYEVVNYLSRHLGIIPKTDSVPIQGTIHLHNKKFE